MLLKPVSARDPLALDDRAAAPPKTLPRGDELEEKLDRVLERLAELQQVFYADARRSLLIVLQGRDASGKDGVVRTVIGACNPAGVQVNSFKAPTQLELAHDYLWRIHRLVPEKGIIGIFNRSHYEDVLVVRVRDLVPRAVWSKRYDQIRDFERLLTENGVVILKFFLHVSRDEQKKRLIDRVEDRTKSWKFNPEDLEDRELWDSYTAAYRDAIRKTSAPRAPWYLVPADKNKARNYLIAARILKTLQALDLAFPKPKTDLRQYLKALK